jgi:hypothetical protein
MTTFVSKVIDETLTTGGWGLVHTGSNNLRFFVDNVNTHYIDYTLLPDTPVIIKCTYDQTTLRMSVNGTPVLAGSPLYGGGVNTSSNALFVGAHVASGGSGASGFLNGTIAEFIYYNRVLTGLEEKLLLLYLSEKYNIPVNDVLNLLVYESWESGIKHYTS